MLGMCKFNLSKMTYVAAIVATFTLASAAPAHASLMLFVSDGTNTLNITDNGVGDADATIGSISLSPSTVLGVFTFNSLTAQSNPVLGSATQAELQVNTDVQSIGAGDLTIKATDTSLPQGGAGTNTFSWLGGGTLGPRWTSGSSQGYLDPNNVAFGTSGTGVITTGLMTFTGPNSGSVNHPAFLSPYSMSLVLNLHKNLTDVPRMSVGALLASNTIVPATVPEPGSLLLLGAGLLGVGGTVRRRFSLRKKA